jgi:hypothetical protein
VGLNHHRIDPSEFRLMRFLLVLSICAIAVGLAAGCATSQGSATSRREPSPGASLDGNRNDGSSPIIADTNAVPVIHVFVALCDNVNQGIVPVSASLGNGDNPATNLYWGAAFGVRTFFSKSKDWELVSEVRNPKPAILARCIFKRRDRDVFMVADAYRGKEISQAIWDFLEAASGSNGDVIEVAKGSRTFQFSAGGSAELVAYVGHDGLMDFKLQSTPRARDNRKRKAIILACYSKHYFTEPLERAGAEPLLWTTNLMAPETYILSAAFEGWLKQETNEQIRVRAAKAYNSYQNCGLKAANGLFATGW